MSSETFANRYGEALPSLVVRTFVASVSISTPLCGCRPHSARNVDRFGIDSQFCVGYDVKNSVRDEAISGSLMNASSLLISSVV